jgi:hypothetical protein
MLSDDDTAPLHAAPAQLKLAPIVRSRLVCVNVQVLPLGCGQLLQPLNEPYSPAVEKALSVTIAFDG